MPFELLGRLHPLLVHLPIGILLFAVGLMGVGRWKKMDVDMAVSLAWGLGALSAVLACGAGWLLAQSGEYDADLVLKHQWMGLATAVLAGLTYVLKNYRWPLAMITVVVLSVAGHYGGNLTHGEDYLFPGTQRMAATNPTEQPLPSAAMVSQRTDTTRHTNESIIRRSFMYRDQVVPVLKASCYTCHSARKKKGGLRLDTESFIRQGGKNGVVLTPGNPLKSKLYTYLLLPEGDERHMPPKGKIQLTARQIAVIYHWIQRGASFREQIDTIRTNSPPVVEAIAGVLPAVPTQVTPDSSQLAQIAAPRPMGLESTLLAKPVEAPDPAVVAALKQKQVSLTSLGEGGYLSANFVNVKTFDPHLLNELGKLSRQVIHLRLSGQPVSDEYLRELGRMKNLTRLSLDHTQLSDSGLAVLRNLPNLEQLNLYGTAITDEGLDVLAQCPTLKVVYLWQTNTTSEGIQRLQQARPGLKIDTGASTLIRPDTTRPDKRRVDSNKSV